MDNGSVELLLESEHAVEKLAARIADAMDQGLVIFLQGNLGAGKTTFARGFLHACGHQGIVKSPTYTLVEPYQTPDGGMCYHFDLYRLADGEELEFTGARDYFDNSSTCLVEWPEKANDFLPEPDIRLVLEYAPQGRHAIISPGSKKGKSVMLRVFPDTSL